MLLIFKGYETLENTRRINQLHSLLARVLVHYDFTIYHPGIMPFSTGYPATSDFPFLGTCLSMRFHCIRIIE